jgi:hypothetical protein
VVEVDARRLVHRQRAAVGEEITEVVARLAACWDDADATPLVARAA